MFGSVILDVAVGLVIVYLLLSLISASVREWAAGILRTRSSTLHQGLNELLADPKLVEDLYNHPLINCLYRGKNYADAKKNRQLPSYIPSKSFSAALLDMIVRGRDVQSPLQSGSESRTVTIDSVRAQITRIQNPRVQRAVLSAVDAAGGDLGAAQANIEHWFDSTMDRVSGWYKQRSQIWVFAIGFVLVVIADADTLNIARRLYSDPAARQTALALAGEMNAAKDTVGAGVAKRAAVRLDSLGLPLVGWQQVKVSPSASTGEAVEAYAKHARNAFIGWLITAFAVSLGAPFWFDTLGRVMVIRNTVKPTQKSPVEASEDRQPTSAGSAPPPRPPVQPIVAVTMPSVAASPAPEFAPQQWAGGHPDAGAL